jgi:hypothetical protein
MVAFSNKELTDIIYSMFSATEYNRLTLETGLVQLAEIIEHVRLLNFYN